MKLILIVCLAISLFLGCSRTPDRASQPVKTIDISKDGTYELDGWNYIFDVKVFDGVTRGWWGYLTHKGASPVDMEFIPLGRKVLTPWGPMYWVDVPQMVRGYHGWLPHSVARDAWVQRGSPKDWENIKDFQQGNGR